MKKCSRTYLLSAKLTYNGRLISSAAQSLRLPKLPGQFATPYCIHGNCSDTTWHCNQDDEAFDEVSELFFIHLCCIYLIYIFRGKVTNLHTVVGPVNLLSRGNLNLMENLRGEGYFDPKDAMCFLSDPTQDISSCHSVCLVYIGRVFQVWISSR